MNAVSDSVFHSRAIRTAGISIEDDPEPMVQQQLARLFFLTKKLELRGKRVLEFGCGSGFNCAFVKEQLGATHVTGFDVSADSVAIAKDQYPDVDLRVADACDSRLSIEPGTWDVVVSFEVLEHVPDMPAFLANVRRHVKPGGVVFLSTPNREVFSLGHEPSPINREHIKELNRAELDALLLPLFSDIAAWGQGFRNPALQSAWDEDVRAKIKQLADGTRWKRPSHPLQENAFAKLLYKNALIRSTWKYLRWELLESFRRKRAIANKLYGYQDFDFTEGTCRALWFCVIARP
jgi:SAM-dependent methyltransferase